VGLAVLGVAAVLAPPGWIDLRVRDATGPGDADLSPAAPRPAPEPNAFDALAQASAALVDPDRQDAAVRERLEAEPFEPGAAEALLTEHSVVLSHFQAAIEAPGFQMAHVAWDESLPDLQSWFTVARLHALGARVRAHAGDGAGAAGELLALLRLGHAVQRDATATMIHAVVGAELKEIALSALAANTDAWQPTPEASLHFARELAAFRTDTSAWRASWAGEYRAAKAALLASGPPSGWSYSYQPNRTLALQAAWTRSLQARAGRPCSELEPERAAPPTRRAVLLRALRPNAVGEILAEVARPSGNRFALRLCAADTRLSATQLALALRASADEHGRVADDLTDLVPEFLDTLPASAYDISPFRFDAERHLLVASGSRLPEATVEQRSPEYALPF
jgi:hypothetical protein